MKLSIIIISYNVCTYLRQCLSSIYSSNIIDEFEIIVVDNFSHDKTCDMIENEFTEIKLIKNLSNKGFSQAVNQGLEISSGEYICILNPDTLLSENIFTILINYLSENSNIACVGPKILNSDGTLQLASKRSIPTLMTTFYKLFGLSHLFPKSKIFGKYNLTYLDENKIHKVDAISGAFMLLKKNLISKIGKFDESFFLYGEDLDYCLRIKNSGYSIAYNPNASIIHYKGESAKNAPFDSLNIFYSAMKIFFKKYSSIYRGWKYLSPFVNIIVNIRKYFSYIDNYKSKIVAFIIDIINIVISYIISILFWYKFYYNIKIASIDIASYYPLLISIIVSWIISSYLVSLYKNNYLSYGRSIANVVLSFLLSATSIYFIGFIAYSRAVLLLIYFMLLFATSFWRISIHILYRYNKVSLSDNTRLFNRRAAVLGTNSESERIGALLEKIPGKNFIFLGYIDDDNIRSNNNFLGRIKHINGIIKKYHISEIIIPEKWKSISYLIDLLKITNKLNISYKIVPDGKSLLIGKGNVEELSGIMLMDLDIPLLNRLQIIYKRSFDIILSSILIFITTPIHLYFLFMGKINIATIWVLNNKTIKICSYQSKQNIIYYLPLLFEIFKGNLSFVGSKIINAKSLDSNILIKPGLIGLSFLCDDNVEKDIVRIHEQHYVMNYSIIYDIEIILKSILKI